MTEHRADSEDAAAAGFLQWDASSQQRFIVGGIGACLPLLLQFISLDTHNHFTDANMLGVFLRNAGLFFLGGLVAYLHSDEVKPVKLLQIGIAAPALITVMITGNAAKPREQTAELLFPPTAVQRIGSAQRSFFLGTAFAQESQVPGASRRAQVSDFLSDVVDGITGKAYQAQGTGGVYPSEPDWKTTRDGFIPPGVMPAGKEAPPLGKELYVCRALLRDGIHPGKMRPEFHGCNVGWGGKEYTSTSYQVLMKKDLTWVSARGGVIPPNAVKAGEEKAPGREPLFVCRAQYNNGIHPGKIRPSFGGCNIGWGGKEEVVSSYEVLVN